MLMKLFPIIFLLIVTFGANAQKKAKLYGSWKSTGENTTTCGDTIIKNYTNIEPFILTLDKNKGNVYKIPETGNLKNFYYEEDKIRIKKNKIILKDRMNVDSARLHKDNFYLSDEMPNIIYNYEIISDSELIVKQKSYDYEFATNCFSEYRLTRYEKQDYISISELNKRYKAKINEVLKTNLFLAKLDSSNRIVSLKMGGELQIHAQNLNKINSTIDQLDYYVDAIGHSTNDSTILVHCIKEKSFFTGNDGYFYNKNKSYSKYDLDSKMTEINMSKISYICFTRPIEYKTHKIVRTLGWLSLVSAVIIAPLISINYKHLDFNKNRYFATAGVSLGFMVVSFTISRLTDGKQYLVGKNFSQKGWKILNKT